MQPIATILCSVAFVALYTIYYFKTLGNVTYLSSIY